MSALIVSALAATALSAVPPSFGSEPYVLDFEQNAPPAHTLVIAGATTLDTSLGSEPFAAVSGNMPSTRVESTVAPQAGPVTLATSLGSEPFILESPARPGARAGHARAASSSETLASNCTCAQ